MSQDFDFVRIDGKDIAQIRCRGRDVLANSFINAGTAFTAQQRKDLGLTGLLPNAVMTLEQQVHRTYQQFRSEPSDIAKFVFLRMLQTRNETLFYRVISEHIEEMLPIIYTPTIGKAIQDYSHTFQGPRGVYLSIDEPEAIEEAFASFNTAGDEIDLIVVTDSEGILGIGDQGVGGVTITTGKLNVYVAAAGIHPHRVMPVVLDTGTDNLDLLNDPAYLGVRHARVRGERYDEFIDRFVQATQKCFPHALLHWEDFAAANAHRILDRYCSQVCTFNDDIQGTAGVVVAAVMSAIATSGTSLSDQRIVIYGAGTAGIGIADLLVRAMMDEGLSRDQAMSHFWGLSSRGLLVEGNHMRDFQAPYARRTDELQHWKLDTPNTYRLADVVRNVKPTILIGTSAQTGSFTKAIVQEMASHVERPIIMPLSNPTMRAEAVPNDLLVWTEGRALIATGSPFVPVGYGGTTYEIAQANNSLIFPGIGLGVATCKASRVTESMVSEAAKAVAQAVTDRSLGASLLPDMTQLRSISARVAIAVCKVAAEQGLAQRELDNPIQDVYDAMWQPVYPDFVAV